MEKETELFVKGYQLKLPDSKEYDKPAGYIADVLKLLKIEPVEINDKTFSDHIMVQLKGINPKTRYAKDIIESNLDIRVTIWHYEYPFGTPKG